eukprot:Platyproteum_vivax@DN5831_c0_g1_i1.p1
MMGCFFIGEPLEGNLQTFSLTVFEDVVAPDATDIIEVHSLRVVGGERERLQAIFRWDPLNSARFGRPFESRLLFDDAIRVRYDMFGTTFFFAKLLLAENRVTEVLIGDPTTGIQLNFDEVVLVDPFFTDALTFPLGTKIGDRVYPFGGRKKIGPFATLPNTNTVTAIAPNNVSPVTTFISNNNIAVGPYIRAIKVLNPRYPVEFGAENLFWLSQVVEGHLVLRAAENVLYVTELFKENELGMVSFQIDANNFPDSTATVEIILG